MREPTGDLGGLLEPVAQAVRADLEAHRSVAGTEGATAIVRRFLAAYCAESRYRTTPGVVVGEREAEKNPFDCLIVAVGATPTLPTPTGQEVVPADSVLAVVEACEDLDRRTLGQAAERVAELKRIHRRPLFRGEDVVNPYLGALVALGGLSGHELLDALAEENDGRPFEEQIDLVCVVDRGLVGHADVEGGADPSVELPVQASPRWRLTWLELGPRSLLAFLLAVWETLGARELRPPRMHVLLRQLAAGGTVSLPGAHGVDRGE